MCFYTTSNFERLSRSEIVRRNRKVITVSNLKNLFLWEEIPFCRMERGHRITAASDMVVVVCSVVLSSYETSGQGSNPRPGSRRCSWSSSKLGSTWTNMEIVDCGSPGATVTLCVGKKKKGVLIHHRLKKGVHPPQVQVVDWAEMSTAATRSWSVSPQPLPYFPYFTFLWVTVPWVVILQIRSLRSEFVFVSLCTFFLIW